LNIGILFLPKILAPLNYLKARVQFSATVFEIGMGIPIRAECVVVGAGVAGAGIRSIMSHRDD